MKLQIYTPLGSVLNCKINKVTMETLDGYYTLLPRHVDFAAAMNANILSYTTEENQERFAACHRGIVVKKGDMVIYSKYSGTDVELDGDDYIIVGQSDILAVIKK